MNYQTELEAIIERMDSYQRRDNAELINHLWTAVRRLHNDSSDILAVLAYQAGMDKLMTRIAVVV